MSTATKTAGRAKASEKGAKQGDKKSLGQKTKEYKADLQEAFNAGYKAGWNDYDALNIRFGSKAVATHGYNKGMRNHKRADKYQKKAGVKESGKK